MLGTGMNIYTASEPEHYTAICDHIISLNRDDRYLRFGYPATDERIRAYVDSTQNSEKSIWFCVEVDGCLVGTLHVAFGSSSAEFGLTVSSSARNMGIGKLMFANAYFLILERGIKQIHLYCLSQNKAIQKLARSFGLQVITCGSDSEATVTIQYPVPLAEMKKLHGVVTLSDPKLIDLN